MKKLSVLMMAGLLMGSGLANAEYTEHIFVNDPVKLGTEVTGDTPADYAANGLKYNGKAIQENRDQIKKIGAETISNTNKISENSGKITDLTTKVDTVTTQSNQNKETISQNSEKITNLNTRVEQVESFNNQKFEGFQNKLNDYSDEMKKGFAAQAALSGLFQPYHVGKFNLTGGIGTYESEVGMALGAGYRVNENFAVKAGVATNTADFDAVTTNASFNIEW